MQTTVGIRTVLVILLLCAQPWVGNAQESKSAVGDALKSMFNPVSAPDAATMGLLQRSNFVDRVAGTSGRLELVFVIDATESMADQLDGVRQTLKTMLDDIRRVSSSEVYLQIVLFRDVAAPSGAVSWPLGHQNFTRESDAINAALEQLRPETGAPYFLEAVDVGLQAALTQIAWNQDASTTRWIFLIGDAPPYDRGFSEPETGAGRKYSSEQLIQLAQQSGVEINAILCPTRSSDEAVYEQVVGSTRYFFGELTSQTGGWMMDLSDPQLLANVTKSAGQAVSDFIKIEPITRGELDEVRAQAAREKSTLDPDRRVRIAVLPHLDLPEMNFSRRDPAVRFADEMRSQLELVGSDVEVVSNYELKRTFDKIQPITGMSRDAALQQIGLGVAADFVLWGALVDGQPDKVQSGILDTKSGEFIVKIPSIDTQFPARASLCSTVLDALAVESKKAGMPMQLARVQRKFRTRLVADTEEMERLILSARGQIWDAVQLELGEEGSQQLYAAAETDLLQAVRLEPNNPIANALLANVYFSQFQILQAANDKGAVAKSRAAINFASEAMKNLSRALEADQLEIEADFHFYRGDFKKAAEFYEAITSKADTLAQVQRARWMLAGIYSGDWGVDQHAADLVDASRARAQIVQLLAFFEDSSQTKLLRKYLLWDETRGATLNPNVPLTHADVVNN